MNLANLSFKAAMSRYSYHWVEQWCLENGWTDLFLERRVYWAFPPNAVMPLPVPSDVLEQLRAKHGLTMSERGLHILAIVVGLMGGLLGWILKSPMPLVMSFAFCAICVALLDSDDD